MSFFYQEAKKAPRKPAAIKRDSIPIESLQKLGCQVCPRRADWPQLRTQQMEPTGDEQPLVYLLTDAPDLDDDDAGEHFRGKAGAAIYDNLPKSLRKAVRFGAITQCANPSPKDEPVSWPSIECCRPRVITDIERSKPVVIIGVGDRVLNWATALPAGKGHTTMAHRGSWFPVRIGSHTCWFVPVMYPNWAFKQRKFGKSEYELALIHDLDNVARAIRTGEMPDPKVVEPSEYDRGIELIAGTGAGDFQRLERVLADMAGLPLVGLDIETNGLRPWKLRTPLMLTAAVGDEKHVVAFPIDHPDGWGAESRIAKVRGLFGEWLLYSNLKIAHNLAMEMEWLQYLYGPSAILATDWGDSMAMCHTLDERQGTKALEVQTVLGFGFDLKAQSKDVDPSLREWWLKVPLPRILRYNGMDSKWTAARAKQLLPLLEEDEAMMAEYRRKVDLAPALVMTEAKGLPISIPRAEKLDREFKEKAALLDRKIRNCDEVKRFSRQFGAFNPAASDDVLKLLQHICKRAEVKREDRDGVVSFSTDEEVLSSIPSAEVPSARLILDLRGIEKLRGTYLQPAITGKIISEDGLVHSRYSSMVAVTGRLNAEDPNAQNWPKRKNRQVRSIFYAEDDEEILACDYGQIEFRVVGMASEDRNLVKYCWTGYDVHLFWAQRMVELYPRIKDWIVDEFDVDWDEKGIKTLRQESKNKWVFPQLFGSSLNSCAQQLHLPDDVAKELGGEFWDEFPGVKRWQDRLVESYSRKLYVETLGGRRRRGPMTKNEIINMPIQGTACDIVTAAHVALVHRAYVEGLPELVPSLNVHDDLSTWLKKATREQRQAIIVEEMCKHRFAYINVPLVVEVSVGPDWADLTEIAKFRSDELFDMENPYK